MVLSYLVLSTNHGHDSLYIFDVLLCGRPINYDTIVASLPDVTIIYYTFTQSLTIVTES